MSEYELYELFTVYTERATVVFRESWEELSKSSDIEDNTLQKDSSFQMKR